MIRLTPLIFVLLLTSSGFSQSRTVAMPKQSAYVEFLGSGLTYSFNFERFIYREPKFAVGLRAGAGFTPPQLTWAPYTGVIGLTALWGTEGEYFEVGAYHVVMFNRFANTTVSMASAMVGYRYQPKPKGLLLKFGFMPFFAHTKDVEGKAVPLIPYAGFSVGYGL